MQNSETQQNQGFRLRTINILMVGLVLALSAVLIFTSLRVHKAYEKMTDVSDRFIASRKCAMDMREGSDELSESARSFVANGNLKDMWDYFKVATVSRKRSVALDELDELSPNSPAYQKLKTAMLTSSELMVTEVTAMRLAAEAFGIEKTRLPVSVQNVRLDWRDARLSQAELKSKAVSMLFDENYHEKKNVIVSNATLCIEELQKESDSQNLEATKTFEALLVIQQITIVVIVLIMLCLVLVIRLLLIDPLQKGVTNIRSKMPIQNNGSREFRILANAYNAMFKENQLRAGKLTYDATHDSLTNLYNRNGYEFLCKHVDWDSSALLLVDIDSFKTVNDTYGHATGDAVLCRVAEVLRTNFRFSDLICRLGGDEFIVIMRKTGPVYKELIAKKIRHINELLQQPEEEIPPISISVGVAFGGGGRDEPTLFEGADRAMYSVKNNGKCNCEFSI